MSWICNLKFKLFEEDKNRQAQSSIVSYVAVILDVTYKCNVPLQALHDHLSNGCIKDYM